MPTYVYECQACGNTLERRQSFSDAPLTTHDECGGSLRRLLWPAPVIFKGSGFYNTDYKSGSNGASNGAKGQDSNTESKTESAKTEGTASDSGKDSKADSGKDSSDKAATSV